MHGAHAAPAVDRVGKEHRVREQVVDAPAEHSDEDDVVRAGLEGVAHRELEVGLILLGGEGDHLRAALAEIVGLVEAQRIEVADHELRRDAPALEGERAAVRRDHGVRADDLIAIRGRDVAVADDHGLQAHSLGLPEKEKRRI